MKLRTRKLLDRSTTTVSVIAIILMTGALGLLLGPIFYRGIGAIAFRATVEHRLMLLEQFHHGNRERIKEDIRRARLARKPVFEMLERFETEISAFEIDRRRELRRELKELKESLRRLLGPLPGDDLPVLVRQQYGQTRWSRARIKLHDVLYIESWDHTDPKRMGKKVFVSRVERFFGTPLESLFPYLQKNLFAMMRPRFTVDWGFFYRISIDAHFFGGIWPELLGTFYLTLGAMLFALPMGLIAAIYLSEFSGQGRVVSLLRTCISTLAGVPSIVFGLFGLAFFIHSAKVSASKSVLVGSLTLALLVLPTIIRASEEALRAVPMSYREAALSVGASRFRTVLTVVLPAALPGVLTGVVLSMGRAAGETAPIIFTAAVSVGKPLRLFETLSQPTPALPWNIYNLATEHQAVDEIRHVQYGMLLVLVLLVLLLNITAIWLRARMAKKMHA